MIKQTNAFVVVLDTCVMAPMPLCDTLLRLAEDPAFYMPRRLAEFPTKLSFTSWRSGRRRYPNCS